MYLSIVYNKVSHVDPQVVTDVINLMTIYSGDFTVTRRKKYRFLGINIEISKDKNVGIEMKKQLHEAVDMFVIVKAARSVKRSTHRLTLVL